MVVKMKERPIEIIQAIVKERNGLLLTSDLDKYGIARTYLSILARKGDIQRISRGVYSSTGHIVDEMTAIQARFKKARFSHETAAYLLDLTDRNPLFYSVTVPSGYKANSLKSMGLKVFFMNRKFFSLGEITLKSSFGNDIDSYNLERTICDLLRSRNQLDIQLVNDALKRYAKKREKNLNLLYQYATQLRIQKIVRETLEVLL